MTFKVTEEEARRALESARSGGLKINEAARAFVAAGESADFYLGYLSGIACVVTISRSFLQTLGEAVGSETDRSAEGAANLHLIGEAVEVITMGAAAPAAVVAELHWEASNRTS